MSKEPIEQLREVHAIQGRKGCCDIDDYMLGLYNGLELALSLMEQRDVKYKEREELAKPEQEPVAWMSKDADIVYTSIQVDGCFQHDHIPLYTTPPQRTWVGLMDEEVDYYIVHRFGVATKKNLVELIRLCELKLKEKNT